MELYRSDQSLRANSRNSSIMLDRSRSETLVDRSLGEVSYIHFLLSQQILSSCGRHNGNIAACLLFLYDSRAVGSDVAAPGTTAKLQNIPGVAEVLSIRPQDPA